MQNEIQLIFVLLKTKYSFGKSWNDIQKREKSGGQDWKTLRTKIFKQTPPLPPPSPPLKEEEARRSQSNQKEAGDKLESLRTREEYGDGLPAEGEDSLLKSFRNVGKAALQRLILCPRFIFF